MINHVNAKHTAAKESLRTGTERGTHVEKENGKILKMECDYGKIRRMGDQIKNSDELQRESSFVQDVDTKTTPKVE